MVSFSSQDRKSHENGLPHQEAKSKKVAEIRSGSAANKLDDEIAKLEKAADAAMRAQLAQAPAPVSEYSTYTPIHTIAPQPAPVPVVNKAATSSTSTKPSKTEPTEPAKEEQPIPEASKEAGLPGTWEVVEEVEQDDEQETEEDSFGGVGSKLNTKKRQRYGEEESALAQIEEESREISRHSKGERVPEVYRADSVTPAANSEPVFKSKAAKGGNIKKRVKQL